MAPSSTGMMLFQFLEGAFICGVRLYEPTMKIGVRLFVGCDYLWGAFKQGNTVYYKRKVSPSTYSSNDVPLFALAI